MERSNRLQVGIDIGKGKADYALLHPSGAPLVFHSSFANSLGGLEQAKALLLNTLKQHGFAGVDIGLEATSYYWLPLYIALSRDPDLAGFEPQLALLNAGWVKWFKKSFPPDHKSDQRDPFYIAERLRTLPQPNWWCYDPHWLSLRFRTRLRFHLSQDVSREKNYYQLFLFLAYSGFPRLKPFSDVFGVVSQSLLNQPDLLETLAQLSVEEIAVQLHEISAHHLRDPLEVASRLHQALQESYPLPEDLDPTVQEVLQRLSQTIAFLQQQIDALDRDIATLLNHYPEVTWLDSIPGVGPVFASGIAAEIGDFQRFVTPLKWDHHRRRYRPRNGRDIEDAVAKFAGLWWPQNASGQFDAEEKPMSKRGNAYLRYFTLMAADRMRLSIPSYKAYYSKKLAEASNHKYKRALVLTGRKALGLFVGLLHHQEFYRPEEASVPSA